MEGPLLQKVCALYEQILTLSSLKPSKNVDSLFSELVVTCCRPAPGLDMGSLPEPVRAMRAHLIRLCATAEALLEVHFSTILASFDNPIHNLSIFPYYSNYLNLSLLEFDILTSHCPRVPATVAFVGSGPLPLSSIVMASTHLKGTVFHNFDIDPNANSMAGRLVCGDPDLSRRMVFHTTDVMEVRKGLGEYEVVFLAALVGLEEEDKVRVLRHLGEHMAPGAYLMLRSAHGARAFLYPVVDLSHLQASGFQILSVFHPTNEVINSVLLARKLLQPNSNSHNTDDHHHHHHHHDEKPGVFVNTPIVLPEHCSGYKGFSPMIEELAME